MTLKRKILELCQQGEISETAAHDLLTLSNGTVREGSAAASPLYDEPIAVVGMACRLPDADDLDAFWDNLWRGRDSIREVPAERWSRQAYYSADPDHPGLGYARWGGFIDGVYDFDHTFFGLTAVEASALDPQQRLMLEVAQHTFDHAGYGGETGAIRRTGVFIGARMNNYGRDYFEALRAWSPGEKPPVPINRASLLGKSQNFMACWISDHLNLQGPAMVVDTACSSSLVSFHLACQSLRLRECDMALAGGVDLLLDPMVYVMLSKAKALSPDGRCFVFDHRANGYVPGEGVGAVLLKPLSAARRDGDRIYSLVRASAVNNDGHTIGITTPNINAQIALLEEIYRPDRIPPDSVGYIEAHGTGTAIGDPIEVKALTGVFRRHTRRFAYCGMGSLKSSIGHLHSASGIAGVIKTSLCLHHGALPASLNCQMPNPRFEFVNSPFYPNLTRRTWRCEAGVRRAGISGFGFGGTNCHVVLDEAPKPAMSVPSAIDVRREALYNGRFPKVALPGSTFQRVTCRLPEAETARQIDADCNVEESEATVVASLVPSRPHPLIDWWERDETGTIRFQRAFSINDVLLRDHVVLGVPMIPGVAWLEFLRMGATLGGQRHIGSFTDVTFLEPLYVRDGEKVVAQGIIHVNGHFEVICQARGELPVNQPLVRGRISTVSPKSTARQAIPQPQQLQGRATGTEVYAKLRTLGYLHGPFFQNIGWMADLRENETFAQLRRAPRPDDWPSWLQLDPGLLDSATIVAFGSSNSTSVRSGGRPFIPVFLGKVHVYMPLPDEVFVHTRIHVWNQEMCRCTQTLMDSAGRPCLIIEDIVSKRVPESGFGGARRVGAAVLAEHQEQAAVPIASEGDNAAGPPPKGEAPTAPATPASTAPVAPTEEALLGALGQYINIVLDAENADIPFLSLGLDSATLVGLAAKIEKAAGIQLYPTIFFEHPTPREFLAFLVQEHAAAAARLSEAFSTKETAATEATTTDAHSGSRYVLPLATRAAPDGAPFRTDPPTADPIRPSGGSDVRERKPNYEPVAIIGMAGHYPGAPNLDGFWQRLRSGVDAVGEIPPARWNWRDYFNPEVGKSGKTYSRWGAFLERVDHFDPAFFGIAPREAPAYDPQARLFFTVAWETLEHAGYGSRTATPLQTGIWVGYSHDHYYEQRIKGDHHHLRGLGLETTVANQFSYFMNWRGPSLAVNTLCSSSLVALHQAIGTLHSGECEMALVGGVHAALSPEYYIAMSYQRALSPTGRCRTFDASADGYVPGEGVGAVLLKPLHQALADGDRVWGVITGSAVNHNGRTSRATAPNPDAQTEVIRRAMTAAGVTGADISYVETHGTGTALGDPLEVGALKKAFGNHATRPGSCRLGALKSQIGHLESAAGIAGLHKVVLSLFHRQLPPTLHVRRINPALDLENSPFMLNDRLTEWRATGRRRAGLSSFGMLGVNAHVIIEEAPPGSLPQSTPERTLHPLTLSARSEAALRDLAARYVELSEPEPDALPNICFTANTGRTHFDYRLGVAGINWEGVRAHLRRWLGKDPGVEQGVVVAGKRDRQGLRVAFMITGQGSQYPDMAKTLYATQPVFQRELERCGAALTPYLERPLLTVLFQTDNLDLINETQYTQPALFAVNYALAKMWMSWGIQPAALIGHSVGEYVAACLGSVMNLEDGARMVAARGRLMQGLDRDAGAMVAVLASPASFAADLEHFDGLDVAAVNGPANVVVSGNRRQIAQLCDTLRRKQIAFTPLKVSHAFHSRLMAPIKDAFLEITRTVSFDSPRLPIVSNLTGEVMAAAPDADYWWRHLSGTVRFADGVDALRRLGINAFLEVGPHPVLCELVRAIATPEAPLCIPSLQRGRENSDSLCRALLALYVRGAPIDWSAFDASYRRARLPLPTYPFEEKRYWIGAHTLPPVGDGETAIATTPIVSVPQPHPLLGELVVPEDTPPPPWMATTPTPVNECYQRKNHHANHS